jgi:hypothetical protein
MAEERRYTDEEVEAILKAAAEVESSPQSLLPGSRGMTLSELQEIGREAGISPDAVRVAAGQLTLKPIDATRRFLGLPLGVGRTIELERKLTDEEWDRLVVDLRHTFNARGLVRTEGSLRSWNNGNLQALLEPTQTGQRLRLRTVHGGARSMLQIGAAMFGMAGVMTVVSLLKGTIPDTGFASSVATLGMLGGSFIGVAAIQLPSWARRRRQQMEEIAGRISAETAARLPDS